MYGGEKEFLLKCVHDFFVHIVTENISQNVISIPQILYLKQHVSINQKCWALDQITDGKCVTERKYMDLINFYSKLFFPNLLKAELAAGRRTVKFWKQVIKPWLCRLLLVIITCGRLGSGIQLRRGDIPSEPRREAVMWPAPLSKRPFKIKCNFVRVMALMCYRPIK